MRVAVVGAGVAGLACAHALRDACDVVVYEGEDRPGGHARTVTLPGLAADGSDVRVDCGFIVLNDRNYPRFEALLADLGVATQPSDMSFGVSDATGAFEYASHSPAGLLAVRRHAVSPRFWRMVLDVPRFQRAARALLAQPDEGGDVPLRTWLASLDLSEDVVERVIVPQAAAVWSADPEQLWTFPARFLVRFFANHGMLELRGRPRWSTVAGGSRTYVDALAARLGDRLRCGSPVERIRRAVDGFEVGAAGSVERFDRVVLACHADQALRLLGDDATRVERDLLEAFPFRANEVVLHTDASVMPRRRDAWASWNYHLQGDRDAPPTLTYDMHRLQSLAPLADGSRLLVSMNQTERIDPTRVLATFDWAHPVFTAAGADAQARYAREGGRDGLHLAGAYWGWGFHEDGVVSGLRAAEGVLAGAGAPEEEAVPA